MEPFIPKTFTHTIHNGKVKVIRQKKGQTMYYTLTWPAFLRKEISLRAPSPSLLLNDTPPPPASSPSSS